VVMVGGWKRRWQKGRREIWGSKISFRRVGGRSKVENGSLCDVCYIPRKVANENLTRSPSGEEG